MHVTHEVGGGGKRTAAMILQEEREGNRPLGRPPRRKVEDNSIIGLTEIRWEGLAWIDLAVDRKRWRDFVSRVVTSGSQIFQKSRSHFKILGV